MKKLALLIFLLPFLVTAQTNYYISPVGDDSTGDGSIANPWFQIGYASTQLSAGDTLFVRGGTYDYGSQQTISVSGTAGNEVVFINYPDETPAFDFWNYDVSSDPPASIFGVRAENRTYLKFIGLHVRRLWNINTDDGRASGWAVNNCQYITFTRCVVDSIAGRGFQATNGSTNVYYYYCDAFWCADPQDLDPGNAGTGFLVAATGSSSLTMNDSIYYYQCRAWQCADQGFGNTGNTYTIYEKNWSFSNGIRPEYPNGGGHGFKYTLLPSAIDSIQTLMKNNIAIYNYRIGFHENSNSNRPNSRIYNNLSAKNREQNFLVGYAYTGNIEDGKNIYRNNIGYDSNWNNNDGPNWRDFSITSGAVAIHSHNSWDEPLTEPWPSSTSMSSPAWVNDSQFLAVPDSITNFAIMTAPRQPNGELPDLGDYWRLAPTSGLLNAGIDVGLPYYGEVPDLGPFQYNPDQTGHTLIFQIENETGNAINNARITFNGETRPPGVYTLHGIEEGTYDYSVAAPGYETYVYNGLVVEEDMEINVVMTELPTYNLNFDVKDDQDNPIGNATITFGTITNPAGNYIFSNIPPGTYNYSVVAAGYQTVNVNNYQVDGDATIPVVMSLNNYQINLNASPSAGGSITGQGSYQHGQKVNITANPNTGYAFTNWTENGNVVSSQASYSFTVTANTTLTANFSLNTHNITLNASSSAGGSVTGAGNYEHGQTATITASPNTGYTFTNWTENGNVVSSQASYSFTVTSNRTLTANFSLNAHNIALNASPSAGGSVTGAGNYDHGQTATISASSNTGYTFTNWTENGNVVSSQASYSFTVTVNRTLTANFSLNAHNVTLNASPSAGGSVTGAGNYDHGQTATITASPNTGYTFTNWTENGNVVSSQAEYSFEASNSRNLTANFSQNAVSISLNASPSMGGTVTGGGNYSYGETVNITAMPNEGFTFNNWTQNGTVVSAEPIYSFTANSNKTLTANFSINSYTITLSKSPSMGGNVSGGGNYLHGQNTTITATSNEGFTFSNWTENGTIISTDPNYSFTVKSSRELRANFTLNSYAVSLSKTPAAGGSVAGGGNYLHGQSVNISAIANEGFRFVNWTENGMEISTESAYSFTVNDNRNLIAHFEQSTFAINLTPTPFEGGTVNGQGSYEFGENALLMAVPNEGFTFMNWTENDVVISDEAIIEISITEDRALEANFELQEFQLTLLASPAEGGQVFGEGIYQFNEQAIIKATPNPGFDFLYWIKDGIVISYEDEVSVIIDDSQQLIAYFAEDPSAARITTKVLPAGYGIVSGSGLYKNDDVVTLTAAPLDNEFEFTGWSENDEIIGTDRSYEFVANGHRELTANFDYNPSDLEVVAKVQEIEFEDKTDIFGEGFYQRGETATVELAVSENIEFIGWMNKAGQIVSRANPFIFEVIRNIELVALVKESEMEEFELQITPNPSNGLFRINILEISEIEILNSNGVLLRKQNLSPGNNTINAQEFPTGVYLLKIINPNHVYQRKIIIAH